MVAKRATPTIIESTAAIRTAAAETSFAIFAFGFISGLTISTMASREVLKSSRMRTKAMVKARSSHSKVLKPDSHAAITTIIPIIV